MAQVYSTCPPKTTNQTKKTQTHVNACWAAKSQSQYSELEGWVGSDDMRPLTSAENYCSRKVQDEKSHLAIPRLLNNSP